MSGYGAPIEIRELPIPGELEPGAILVKTAAATMCGSDVHAWSGSVKGVSGQQLPAVLGHEMSGIIVKLGPGVTTDSVGQSIREGDLLMWENGACGKCYNCSVMGHRAFCTNRKSYSWAKCEEFPFLVGAFAEYIYVFPESGRLRVPDGLPPAWVAAATCALRTVMHGYERLGKVDFHQWAVVQGAGPLGLFMTAILNHAGVENIVVVDAVEQRLALARKWGARHTISMAELPAQSDRIQALNDLTHGRGADVLVQVANGSTAFVEGVAMAAKNARYLSIGIGSPATPFNSDLLTMKGVTVIGSVGAEIRHYYKGLQFMHSTRGRYNYDEMFTNRYRLDQINECLASFKAGKEIKPIITF